MQKDFNQFCLIVRMKFVPLQKSNDHYGNNGYYLRYEVLRQG